MNDVSEGRRPMNEATHPIPLPSSPLDSQTVVPEPAPLSDAGAGDEGVSAAPQGMVIETSAEPMEEPMEEP
ncbi:MAG: hypothetical protein IJF59_05475, partial [Clostridia bacterium]|nr:hypothetical protein [Clostridia bacterium]